MLRKSQWTVRVGTSSKVQGTCAAASAGGGGADVTASAVAGVAGGIAPGLVVPDF